MVATIALATAIVGGPAVDRVTDSVAGYSVLGKKVSLALLHDPKSGYYLQKQVDCDFAHVYVGITRDRAMVGVARHPGEKDKDYGHSLTPPEEVPSATLRLATKNGVRIGMRVDQVEARIGAPDRVSRQGSSRQFLYNLYRQITMEDKDYGYALRNTYVFKKGQLIEVQIHGDSIPGCGGDGRDESWWLAGNFR